MKPIIRFFEKLKLNRADSCKTLLWEVLPIIYYYRVVRIYAQYYEVLYVMNVQEWENIY